MLAECMRSVTDFERWCENLTSVHSACRMSLGIRCIGRNGKERSYWRQSARLSELGAKKTGRVFHETLSKDFEPSTLARLVSPQEWNLADTRMGSPTNDRTTHRFGDQHRGLVGFGLGYVWFELCSEFR